MSAPVLTRPTAKAPIRTSRSEALRPLMWRLHFVGGFLAAPVILSLAVTGILFAWNGRIERAIHAEALAVGGPAAVPAADQVQAALDANPTATMTRVVPGDEDRNTAVAMAPTDDPDNRFTVYVDQSTGEVTGTILESERPSTVLASWHSSWGLGQPAESLTELAGSWLLVAVITGLYLWWPRTKGAWRRVRGTWVPRLNGRGTRRWNDLHTHIGLWMTPILLVLVITGLTWTEYAGSNIGHVRTFFGGEAPELVSTLDTAEPGQADLSHIDTVIATARDSGFGDPLAITPPTEDGTAWVVLNDDRTWPLARDTHAVDGVTGEIVSTTRWADTPLMGKLTLIGIYWHQAELFGTFGRISMTALALGVIASIVFGYVLWWTRRPKGELGASPKAGRLLRTTPVGVGLVALVLGLALPTLGVAFVAFLVLERLYGVAIRRRGWAQPVDRV